MMILFLEECSMSSYNQGYKVIEAEDGYQALSLLTKVSPDLAICDLSMPILNGLEFVEISHEYPGLPVVVVSATQDMNDVAGALKLGIKDFHTNRLLILNTLANLLKMCW